MQDLLSFMPSLLAENRLDFYKKENVIKKHSYSAGNRINSMTKKEAIQMNELNPIITD